MSKNSIAPDVPLVRLRDQNGRTRPVLNEFQIGEGEFEGTFPSEEALNRVRPQVRDQTLPEMEAFLRGAIPAAGVSQLNKVQLGAVVTEFRRRTQEVSQEIMTLPDEQARLRRLLMENLSSMTKGFVHEELISNPLMQPSDQPERALVDQFGLTLSRDAVSLAGKEEQARSDPRSARSDPESKIYPLLPVPEVSIFFDAERVEIPESAQSVVRSIFPHADLSDGMLILDNPSYEHIGSLDPDGHGLVEFHPRNLEAFHDEYGLRVLSLQGIAINEAIHVATLQEFPLEGVSPDLHSFLNGHPEFDAKSVPSNKKVAEFLSDVGTFQSDPNLLPTFFWKRSEDYSLTTQKVRDYLTSVRFTEDDLAAVQSAPTLAEKRQLLGDISARVGLSGYEELYEGLRKNIFAQGESYLAYMRARSPGDVFRQLKNHYSEPVSCSPN